MTKLEQLAKLMCPDVTLTINDLEERYKPRNLKEGARVTRFAPSPTGFLHTGSLFASFVAAKLAHDTDGIFYLRIEDTDTKREVKGSTETLINQLALFNVKIDEGYSIGGEYGPYIQSERSFIYNTVIYDMVTKGLAYPCFCSASDLEQNRNVQTANKERPGYYGKYAKCRNISVDEAITRIQNGEKYVVRFKSSGNFENHISFKDQIRGELSLSENDLDIVIRKSDGLPTYHFAHACDDHFMHTNNVVRGEEWLPSAPIHVQLFNALNFELPNYAHLPVIMKNDNGNRRKLSKRLDPEASVSYFIEQGYPTDALLIYLCTIANSNYEEFRLANPDASVDDFKLTYDKFSLDGALFDLEKINNISKDVIFKTPIEQLVNNVKTWAQTYDTNLLSLINEDEEMFAKIMNFGKNDPQPRKDYYKYAEIYEHIKYMYANVFDTLEAEELSYPQELINQVCNLFIEDLKVNKPNKEEWFNHQKEIAREIGFAYNKKDMKNNGFSYMFGEYMGIIRVALTKRKNAFDLVDIIETIGMEETVRRLTNFVK